jgi:hypothetical protein
MSKGRSPESAFRRSIKSVYISDLKKKLAQSEALLKQMKEDPQGVIAPFLDRLEVAVQQNNRLTALTATLIERDGPITVSQTAIDSHHGYKVNINFQLEGDNVTFTLDKSAVETVPPEVQEEVEA